MINTPTFADLGLSAQTIKAIEHKGFTRPTGIQTTCIPLLLKAQAGVAITFAARRESKCLQFIRRAAQSDIRLTPIDAGSRLPETALASVLASLYKGVLDPARYRNSYIRGTIRLDVLDKRNLVDYLVSKVGAENRDIQEITIQDNHSFISAPNLIAEQILTAFARASGPAIISRAKPDDPNGKTLSARRKGERNRHRRSYRKTRTGVRCRS